MPELVLNFLWAVMIGATFVACAVAALVVFVTRNLH